MKAFKSLLRQPQYHVLLTHDRVELASAALPLQRQFLQEVLVYSSSSSHGNVGRGYRNHYNSNSSSSSSSSSSGGYVAGGWRDSGAAEGGDDGVSRFLWRMAMHGDGCWMVKAIEAL